MGEEKDGHVCRWMTRTRVCCLGKGMEACSLVADEKDKEKIVDG